MSHCKKRIPELLDRRTVLASAAASAVALPFSAVAATFASPYAASSDGGDSSRWRSLTTDRHRTAYLEAGPTGGPLIMFLHGHSELGVIWRSQIEHFAAAGWRCVAPDMRGSGGSSKPEGPKAYTIREIVTDMVELHEALGGAPAVWVGHEAGAPIVWQLAAGEHKRCRAVVNFNLPYFPVDPGRVCSLPHVDRTFSPLDRYLLGQRNHMQFYSGGALVAKHDGANGEVTWMEAPMGAGQTTEVCRPKFNATVPATREVIGTTRLTSNGSASNGSAVFAGKRSATSAIFDSTIDGDGLAGPYTWYHNEAANRAYAQETPNGNRLTLPVLYFHAQHDAVVDTINSRLAEPMRESCADLTEATFDACNCLPKERPEQVNRLIGEWLTVSLQV